MKVIIREYTNVVGTFKDVFAESLSNVTGVIINVDKLLTHQNSEGKADNRRLATGCRISLVGLVTVSISNLWQSELHLI